MTAVIRPSVLKGTISAPPSKSAAHRALICAALSKGPAGAAPVSDSNDMLATRAVLEAFGFPSSRKGQSIAFSANHPAQHIFPCRESGSTLRFLLPVAAALGLEGEFTGEGRLPERPLEPLLSLMKAHGISFSGEKLPLSLSGKLTPGLFELPGNISSQFISGLLFALPLLEGTSEIHITSPLQSAGYVELTIQILAQAGIKIEKIQEGFRIPGNQLYQPILLSVEGDWSGGAFWICAGALSGKIAVIGVNLASAQGDKAVIPILEEMGASVSIKQDTVIVIPSPLHGCRIDAGPIPDLIPILAVTAAYAQGDTEFYNAGRLRLKESDRLSVTAEMLRALGGNVEEFPDRLIVHGGSPLHGGTVNGANDHRIVMSAAIAACCCKGPVTISDAQAVSKSYPDFFEAFQKLGGDCDVF